MGSWCCVGTYIYLNFYYHNTIIVCVFIVVLLTLLVQGGGGGGVPGPPLQKITMFAHLWSKLNPFAS